MANFIVVLVLIGFLNKRLPVTDIDKEWMRRVLKPLQIITVVVLVLRIVIGIVTNDKLDSIFNLLGFLITSSLIFILYKLRENKIVSTLLLAILPFYVITSVIDFLKYYFSSFYRENDGKIAVFSAAALIWLIAYFVGASKTAKSTRR